MMEKMEEEDMTRGENEKVDRWFERENQREFWGVIEEE